MCVGRCRKVIYGAIIRHISDAQKFRGATVVNGALEFQIRNGNPNIINELTEAFGTIEEITDYLKVTHSFSITTLGFLKKLRLIKGLKLDINNASLVVLDNPNLSNLFDEQQKIDIRTGRFFFHYNPRLCLSKIEALGQQVGIYNFTEMEVQPESNGEKIACDIVDLNIIIENITSISAKIIWDVYKPRRGQNLLSYLLNYIETNSKTVTHEINSCGNNTWNVIDVQIVNSSKSLIVTKIINNLKPWTRYAVYVKTLATRDRNNFDSPTGQSKIIYFTTNIARPTPPVDVTSFSPNNEEIVIEWEHPLYPNGPIGYYLIKGIYIQDDPDIILKRDYCAYEPSDKDIDMMYDFLSLSQLTALQQLPIDPKQPCCKNTSPLPNTMVTKNFDISCFKNLTLTTVSKGGTNYCSLNESIFDFSPHTESFTLINTMARPTLTGNDKLDYQPSAEIFNRVTRENVSSKYTSVNMRKLKHFSLHKFSLVACGVKSSDNKEFCSSIQQTFGRTKKKDNADDIIEFDVDVKSDDLILLSWKKPKDPNGIIVGYKIEYINTHIKDAKKITTCNKYPSKTTYKLNNLSPGIYNVRLQAMSISGHGKWTNYLSFTIGIKDNNYPLFIGLFALILFIICLILSHKLYNNWLKKQLTERLITTVNPEYIETQYVRDHWEVDRHRVTLSNKIVGTGHFGMVYKGTLDENTGVAIKTIPEPITESRKNGFLNEASTMKNFSSYHLVKLLGVVSEGAPPFVIMELMEEGDLKTYLRKIRTISTRPNQLRIVRMAGEIAGK